MMNNSSDSFNYSTKVVGTVATTTPAPKDIVNYVNIPDWFNEVFNHFNYVLAILQIIAFAITSVHLTILTRKELRSNAIYRMMIGISICDLISQVLSFIAFSPFWIRSTKVGEECYVTTTYQDALINKYGVGVLDDTQRSATWLGMFMALYRVLSVMFPMSQRMGNMSKAWVVPLVVILTVAINGLVSTTAMWNHEIVRQRKDFSCNGTQHILPDDELRYLNLVPQDRKKLHAQITFIYGIIKALPSLIEPTLAFLLILELRKAAKRRKSIKQSGSEKSRDNTTAFILFITLSSFMLEVPNGFSHFAFSFFENSPLVRTIAYLIMCFAEIFPVVNSSTHPFVCFFMSTQYRETAKSFFGFTSKQTVVFVEECKTQTFSKVGNKSGSKTF